MNCYGRPLCSTSSSVKLLQHEGAPQIVANKQEIGKGVATRRALKLSIASLMLELPLRAPVSQ